MEQGVGEHERGKPGSVPSDHAARVGDRLRRIFDDALAEPLPDIFEDLLRKLE